MEKRAAWGIFSVVGPSGGILALTGTELMEWAGRLVLIWLTVAYTAYRLYLLYKNGHKPHDDD